MPAGDLTLADLAALPTSGARAHLRAVSWSTCMCGMGPPSSGAHTVAQTLRSDRAVRSRHGAARCSECQRAMHLIAEAEKLAYADRNRYLADPDFVRIPAGLLDDGYLARRRALIAPLSAAERVQAGAPDEKGAALPGDDATVEASGTSHVSIIDGDGNAVSMTTTIEAAFGSRLWAAGFLLNNELTDFSFRPTDAQGRPIANRIEGGKRPRSSMAPTIVFDADGQGESRARIAGRQPDHSLRGEIDRGAGRLEHGRAGGVGSRELR